jgi:hypothetical protein
MAGMGRSTKAERRLHREAGKKRHRHGWHLAELTYSEQRLGPGVVSASPAEVLAAMGQLPPQLDWQAVESSIVPLFERVRPYPPNMPTRVQAIVAPGVTIGFGIDVGPAFITVTPELIESWSISVGDLAVHALANLHTLAGKIGANDIERAAFGSMDVVALQTHRGIGSVLVLAPTELARIFGSEPGLFIAPMRDLLIRFPLDADPADAAWLHHEIASADPNCLSPRAFVFDGQSVTVEALLMPLLAA